MRAKTLIIAAAGIAAGVMIGLISLQGLPGGPWSAPSAPRSVGAAMIGGPFALTDHTGKPRTDKDFRGRYMLVFFGFLYCPDICPATLQVVTEALERLGPKAKKVVPIFISVDPERDTPEALKNYLSNFHPSLVGLTGSAAQVKAAARAYRAYYKKRETEDLPGSYTMDHSSILYVMGPTGRYLSHFTHGTSPKQMAARLDSIL